MLFLLLILLALVLVIIVCVTGGITGVVAGDNCGVKLWVISQPWCYFW